MGVHLLRGVRTGLGLSMALGLLVGAARVSEAAGFEDLDTPPAVVSDDARPTEMVGGELGGEYGSALGEGGQDGAGAEAVGSAESLWESLCPSCRPCDACEPPYGMVNRLIDNKHACWTFRTDALLLWREAPRFRPLNDSFPSGLPLPNANQLDSGPAAGPRFSIFRTNGCGDALEATYFRAANWRAVSTTVVPTESLFASLGAAAQSFELNGRTTVLPSIQLLGGFRWFQWQENLYAVDTITSPDVLSLPLNIGTINDLYGYQIGFDSLLWNSHWLRVEGLMKGGAYYNRAVMSGATLTPFGPYDATVRGKAAAFVGEVGLTGVMPVSRNIDFRFGYLGLWLQGLAQPTNQYRTVSLDPAVPAVIDVTGGTVLQGLTLGLEGRW
jgi:hypothetical protein